MKTFLVRVEIDNGARVEHKTGVVVCESSTEIEALIEEAVKRRPDYSNDLTINAITSTVIGEESLAFFLN